jgi:uncharacterized membrane protein
VEVQTTSTQLSKETRRIGVLDSLRGFALLAMASYHFTWDLEFFGYIEPGTAVTGPWKIYARCIASTFLFLVGFSLYLAHGNGIRWRSFGKRFGQIAVAAVLISIVTYFVMGNGWIFFGILHGIALMSLFALPFLRLPVIITLVAAVVSVALPFYAQSPLFDHASLWWLGLSETLPRSNDYVPLFPWFAAVLSGIAAAKLTAKFGWLEKLALLPNGPRLVSLAGRHSMAFYLIHQPVSHQWSHRHRRQTAPPTTVAVANSLVWRAAVPQGFALHFVAVRWKNCRSKIFYSHSSLAQSYQRKMKGS